MFIVFGLFINLYWMKPPETFQEKKMELQTTNTQLNMAMDNNCSAFYGRRHGLQWLRAGHVFANNDLSRFLISTAKETCANSFVKCDAAKFSSRRHKISKWIAQNCTKCSIWVNSLNFPSPIYCVCMKERGWERFMWPSMHSLHNSSHSTHVFMAHRLKICFQ